ncbi:MAG: hypothetical protein BMS9Abin07_1671 [Acidimicrobiia bacterium]|nr:MAG: hypothetical protein BMS9Abin07_1671 [Acidimicrobiia bacterium]
MSDKSTFKKRLYTSAVALGLALGSVGIAAAATGGGSAPAAPAEDSTEIQEPAYTGSVQAPAEDETLTEAEETSELEGLAKITAEEAASKASAAVPGDVTQVELDNENGTVVYSVEITDDAGGEIDVKVDAGDGTVLDQQADDDESDEADEADDDDIQHENENGGDNDPDEGQED